MVEMWGLGRRGGLSQALDSPTLIHSYTHSYTLTDTYTPVLAQPYVYIYGDTHTPLALHWLAQAAPSSILNSQARQPLAEGSGNPLGAGGGGWP